MKKKISILVISGILIWTSLSAGGTKSPLKAALFSAILPGAGEFYAQNNSSAFISLSAEALMWLGYFGFLQHAEWAKRDYKQYAYAYSGTGIRDGSEQYYTDLQHFFSSEQYNNNVYLYARDWGQGYYGWSPEECDNFIETYAYTGEEEWDWGSEEVWYRYGELRREENKYEIRAQMTIGIMVANRVISMVKAVQAVNAYNKNIEAEKDLSLQMDLDPYKPKISIGITKKF